MGEIRQGALLMVNFVKKIFFGKCILYQCTFKK